MLATVTVARYFPASDRTVQIPVHGAETIDSTLPAATLQLFPLDEATVTAKGLTAPLLQELDRRLDDAITLEEEAVAAARAREKREAERRQKLATDEARRRAASDAKVARVRRKHDERLKVWSEHPLRKSVLEQHAGNWPKYLDVPPSGEGDHYGVAIATPFPHQQWQAQLYTKFIRGRNDGTTVTIKECTAEFVALDTENPLAKEAVTYWFHRLLKWGVLKRVEIVWRDGSTGLRYVTSTPTVPKLRDDAENELVVKRNAERSAAQGAEHERDKHDAAVRRENRRQAEEARKATTAHWESTLMSLAELIATTASADTIPPEFQNSGWCPDCRKGISGEANIARGYHFYCTDFVYSTFGRVVPPRPQA